jgi:hypothetical protein
MCMHTVSENCHFFNDLVGDKSDKQLHMQVVSANDLFHPISIIFESDSSTA